MRFIKWCFFFFLSLCLIGCGKKEIVGTEKVVAQVRHVAAFSSLNVGGYYDINITIGSPQLVTIRANGNLLPYIETTVSSKTLTIAAKKGYLLRPQGVPTVDIVVPTLSEIDLSGNNQVTLKGVAKGDLVLNFSGSNQFVGQGNLASLTIQASGNTTIDAQKLLANTVDVDTTGSSKILLNVKNKLKVKIAGTATINYLGDPKIEQSINGSGAVNKIPDTINK